MRSGHSGKVCLLALRYGGRLITAAAALSGCEVLPEDQDVRGSSTWWQQHFSPGCQSLGLKLPLLPQF